MNCSESPTKQQEMLQRIRDYVCQASGLRLSEVVENRLRILQIVDGKTIEFDSAELGGVLSRSDTEGQEFLQVNFVSGKKILITNNLIGFKPVATKGLDLSKLPRVVTTPDILSVFEAIEEALHLSDATAGELAVLKRIYEAVLTGGESVGFDLKIERDWLKRIPAHAPKASA